MGIKGFIMCVLLTAMLSAHAQTSSYTTDYISFETIKQYEDAHREEIKAEKKDWDAKAVRPVFDIYNNNKLLGYIIHMSGKTLLKKDPSYSGPMKNVQGFIDAEGKIVVPFGKYSELNFYKDDTDKYIWLKAFTTDKSNELAHGVVSLDGREIVPPLYHKIAYRPGTGSQEVNPGSRPGTSKLYISGQDEGPSFEAYSDYTSSSGNVSVYGIDGSLRLSHIPSKAYVNLGKYILTDMDASSYTGILNRLTPNESSSRISPDVQAIYATGKKLGLYRPDGTQLLPNEYSYIEIIASKDCSPYKLDGLCYVVRDIDGVESCGIYDLANEKWTVPVNFSTILLDSDKKDGIRWKVWRDELSEYEYFNPDNDYTDRFADNGAKLYNERRYADAINYYAANGIDSPTAKAYSAFSLMNIATQGFYNMVNEVSAVEYCMQNNRLWTKPLTKFDFNTCDDYLNMALASASDYMTLYDGGYISGDESKYHNQVESLQYDVDYYKKQLADYSQRYARAVNYVGNSIQTVNAQQQAMQQAYINAFANMFSNITSAISSSGSHNSKSTGATPGMTATKGGTASGSAAASSGNDGPSVEWKKNRIRELMKQHDYYMKVVEREESRPEKSTSAMNLIQSSKRHLEEIDEEIRKWSN